MYGPGKVVPSPQQQAGSAWNRGYRAHARAVLTLTSGGARRAGRVPAHAEDKRARVAGEGIYGVRGKLTAEYRVWVAYGREARQCGAERSEDQQDIRSPPSQSSERADEGTASARWNSPGGEVSCCACADTVMPQVLLVLRSTSRSCLPRPWAAAQVCRPRACSSQRQPTCHLIGLQLRLGCPDV